MSVGKVRNFESPKKIKIKDILPNHVIYTEFGDYGNYVTAIVKMVKKTDNARCACLYVAYPNDPNSIFEMYHISCINDAMEDYMNVIGVYA